MGSKRDLDNRDAEHLAAYLPCGKLSYPLTGVACASSAPRAREQRGSALLGLVQALEVFDRCLGVVFQADVDVFALPLASAVTDFFLIVLLTINPTIKTNTTKTIEAITILF